MMLIDLQGVSDAPVLNFLLLVVHASFVLVVTLVSIGRQTFRQILQTEYYNNFATWLLSLSMAILLIHQQHTMYRRMRGTLILS